MIDAVLFDLDETLLDRTNSLVAFLDNQYHRFQHHLGNASFVAWRDRFLALDERGMIHKSIVYPKIIAEFGGNQNVADDLISDYRHRCCEYARPFPGVIETLCELRERGLSLGIITNGETAIQTSHIDTLKLNNYVDVVLISETEGVRKPDIRLFSRAAQRVGALPAQCIFVGDNPSADILGAHKAGMQTAWLTSGAQWPETLAVNPGPVISALPQVIALIDRCQ